MPRTIAVVLALVALLMVAACTASGTNTAVPHGKPSGTAAPPPATVRPNPDHVRTLSAVLRNLQQHYADVGQTDPGGADVLAYDLGDLWRNGIDGTGTTIALVEAWPNPQVNAAMVRFDQLLGLPAPDIHTIYPTGTGQPPTTCPPGMVALGSYGSCDAWAGEMVLDVTAAHLVAPYAKILVVVAPPDSEITDDAASQVAPPEMMRAVEYVGEHHLADVISISDNTGETSYSDGVPEIRAQDPGQLAAAAAGIPVVVGTGDCGPVQNRPTAAEQCGDTTSTPETGVWDDSPWVTAVGGSVPNLDPRTGARLGSDPVWQQDTLASGAGYSSVYPRPDYQSHVVTGNHRSVPDITMDSQLGTSESTPLFGGVLALAAQLNHAPVGPINDVLYNVLGPHGTRGGVVDITSGGNGVPGSPGYAAGPGFDVASGWGTINAATFVPALVSGVRSQADPPSAQAAAELDRLRHSAHVTGNTVTASGFLPRHPVTVTVDGRATTPLTADRTGHVTYRAPRGRHTVALHGMLITETATVR
jgi:subtilase family serine protease